MVFTNETLAMNQQSSGWSSKETQISTKFLQPCTYAAAGSKCEEEDAEGIIRAHLSLAHQEYKDGNYDLALLQCIAVHEKRPLRTDVLLLLGAIYYQLRDFDACIEKNNEAIRIDPYFGECYGNLANALKEKGYLDHAIRYYMMAVQLRPTHCDAWSNLASAYLQKGYLQQAADCCREALLLNPNLVDAYINLGNLLNLQGLSQHAYTCYLEALRIDPLLPIAWSNLGGLFMEKGHFQRSLLYYKEALRLRPDFADAHLNQGNVLKALGRPKEAMQSYQRAIQYRPDFAIAYGNLGSVLYEQGQLELAITHYCQALNLDSTFVEAYSNLGCALRELGKAEQAMSCFKTCLALDPFHAQALVSLGNIYLEWNLIDDAAQLYKRATAVTQGLCAPYTNLAFILKQQGHFLEAIACYNEVIRINPLAADGLVNRGNTLKEVGRVTEAVADYLRAIRVQPSMAEAHANLASAYKDSGHAEAAIQSYRTALLLRADFPEATCNLLHTLQCVCDWDDREEKFVKLEAVIKKQIQTGVLPSVQPFHAIAYPLEPMLALEISQKYAEHCALAAARYSLPPVIHPKRTPLGIPGSTRRLRIGYVSSDFGNHPLSHLMGSVFGMHNRSSLEVFCYALSPGDGSEWRQRISREAEHFVDVSALGVDSIASRIAADSIQILVNLNGYTKGARNEIFALRPAPVQISYMGFPGTTGASYIDYLVSDALVSPSQFAHIYSEKLVHLPHCYFVNDYKQCNQDALDPAKLPKRSEYGLPEGKFLFACFNQLYKMDPDIFTTWCNILKRVPDSVLWLLRFPAAGEARLRAFAEAQGLERERVIFTDVAAKQEHIRRSSLADLFLDTPLCNAHTTGTDVLWAGLPMVTLPLEKMATRVAMSLCYATNCGEEMVVSSMAEYEERAVLYASNPAKLAALRDRLRVARLTCPLFDTHRWVKNFDRAFLRMWKIHCEMGQPESFAVTEEGSEFEV